MNKKMSGKSSKKITIPTIIILVLSIIAYLIDPNLLMPKERTNQNSIVTQSLNIKSIPQGYPKGVLPSDVKILRHTYYGFAYSPKLKDSYWVAYILTKKMVKHNRVTRDNEEFTKDPLLNDNYALSSDYINSGYDRGHMVPAADMHFNHTAMSECFYMTNITPQKPGFNRGIWRELEEKVRDWAVQNDSLYIVAGAIYSSRPRRIGKNRVAVPKQFYKVIMDISHKNGYKAIAFLFYNKNYPDDEDFMDYALSVSKLEEITGLKFFANIDNHKIDKIKNSLNKDAWLN